LPELLPAIEIETTEHPTFSVIWLHGLGADGSDFVPVVPELGLPEAPGIRFIFPHAPSLPVTCNGGYLMPAWYDIISLDSDSRRVDAAGILKSRQAICRLIERENQRGIPSHNIFLAGFSQGGAVAYMTALTYPEKLAGVLALSTYIPTPERLLAEATPVNKQIPIFAAHGIWDDVVSPKLGLAARDLLLAQAYPLVWHEYPMQHSVCIEEIQAIGEWLAATMATALPAAEGRP
jgi:phospholipase/carboxylesterase